MALGPDKTIFEIGTFDARTVRELAAHSRPSRRREAVEPRRAAPDDVRIYATAEETALLMGMILAQHRFDVALSTEDGNSQLDVRGGEGVTAAIVDLVATAISEDKLDFVTLCVGKRTFSLYPATHRDLLAA